MSTEEKQNFLREKILEKGYDVNEFVEFLTQKKRRRRRRCFKLVNGRFKNSSK